LARNRRKKIPPLSLSAEKVEGGGRKLKVEEGRRSLEKQIQIASNGSR
jgi:hypothetical protein